MRRLGRGLVRGEKDEERRMMRGGKWTLKDPKGIVWVEGSLLRETVRGHWLALE